jgi:ABC-type cobalamin/Fe3+-siderophores transport system ATPase subunit
VIGDNGAGKSSLIKCLSGATIPDQGEIILDGKPIHYRSPIDARRVGIETVYQDLAVAPAMTIAPRRHPLPRPVRDRPDRPRPSRRPCRRRGVRRSRRRRHRAP